MRLVNNWRQGWRFWSVILGVFGLIAECADMLLPIWNMLPSDVASMIPAATLRAVGAVLWGLALIARFIHQEKAHVGALGKA